MTRAIKKLISKERRSESAVEIVEEDALVSVAEDGDAVIGASPRLADLSFDCQVVSLRARMTASRVQRAKKSDEEE
jgi:hypothetical protein